MIDALGNHPDQCWPSMIDNNDYYRETGFEEHPYALYPERESWILPSGLRTKDLSRSSLYAFHAINQALQHARLNPCANVGVFFSTTTGGNDLQFSMIEHWKLYPRKVINSMCDSLASQISLHYGFKGINTCIQSACATGLVTIDYAMKFIDDYDYIIVGGSDIGINGIDIPAFKILNALGTYSRPFDSNRDGFIMGEGAGCLILESETRARDRGATIHAYLHQVAHFSDAIDRTAPSGEGAVETMRKAATNKPCVINAHGTSTPIGDEVEHRSIQTLFPDTPIYSCKGKIGHTFAAAGVLETIYSILSMQQSIIPHTHGCVNSMDSVVVVPREQDMQTTLNNSFGFGGRCCSQLIEINND